MKPTLIFPTVLIALDVGAAVVYAVGGEYVRAWYWLSAASISICATIM